MPNTVMRKPEWLRIRMPAGSEFKKIVQTGKKRGLATICEEAKCPNQWECWKEGTATFLLMGDTCTRSCRFCSVKSSKHPPAIDKEEHLKLAETLKILNLKYVVLTSVDRDDLPDYGAGHFKRCVQEIKNLDTNLIIELLTPDFQGDINSIRTVVESQAEVIGHNLECTRQLTSMVRDPRASYDRSLNVLKLIKQMRPQVITKSSIMLGFGESDRDILETMADLKDAGVEIITIGQYLQPNRHKLRVKNYIHPDKFDQLREEAMKIGFDYVASGPLVRSSYRAAEHYLKYRLSKERNGVFKNT